MKNIDKHQRSFKVENIICRIPEEAIIFLSSNPYMNYDRETIQEQLETDITHQAWLEGALRMWDFLNPEQKKHLGGD